MFFTEAEHGKGCGQLRGKMRTKFCVDSIHNSVGIDCSCDTQNERHLLFYRDKRLQEIQNWILHNIHIFLYKPELFVSSRILNFLYIFSFGLRNLGLFSIVHKFPVYVWHYLLVNYRLNKLMACIQYYNKNCYLSKSSYLIYGVK